MKKAVTDRHCDGQTYVITNDLGERIEALRFTGLTTLGAGDKFFIGFRQKLKDVIQTALPHMNVVSLDMKRLVEDVWTQAMQVQKNVKDAVVISSCAEFAASRRGLTIEINRIVNQDGEIIGLGPRPGAVPLDKQLNGIAAMAKGNPVVIVEDGIFTGSTMLYLLEQLSDRDVNVVAIAAGICFPKATKRLRKEFRGELLVIQEVEEPYEWMPDHDFVPFVPNCGRVFGGMFGDNLLPYYTHEGLSYCFPYVLPFGSPAEWASIPKGHARSFSDFCLSQAEELYYKLNELNNRRITPRDLIGSAPRISMPIVTGGGKLPDPDRPITDFISEVRQELTGENA